MFDPILLALALALIPGRWLGKLVRLRTRLGFALPILTALLVASSTAVAGPLAAIALGSLLLPIAIPLELIAGYGLGRTPGRRWLGLGAVAALLAVLVDLSVAMDMLAHDGHAAPWLLNLFNQLFLVFLVPLLGIIGAQSAESFLLGYFTPTLIFLSDHLFALVSGGMLLLAMLLYEVARGKLPSLPPPPKPFPPRPAPLLAVVLGAAVVLPVLWAEGRSLPDALWAEGRSLPDALWALREFLAAALVLRGGAVLYLYAQGSALFRALLSSFVVIAALHPRLLWILGLIALADLAGGASGLLYRGTGSGERFDASIAWILIAVRRSTRLLPLLLVFGLSRVPAAALMDSPGLAPLTPPQPTSEELEDPAPSDRRPIRAGGAWISVDAYEFPNRLGEMPTTGLDPHGAAALCAERGQHLCERREWWWACSGAGRMRHPAPDGERPRDDRIPFDRIRATCNLAPSTRILPSGSSAQCHTVDRVYDLVGNVSEWVALPERPGYHGLVGSDIRYQDFITTSCDGVMVIHESQLPALDARPLGARCCG